MTIADFCRKHGVSDASICTWKAKSGGMNVSEAEQLEALEDGNNKLKQMLADATFDNVTLSDLLGKKWRRPLLGSTVRRSHDRSDLEDIAGHCRISLASGSQGRLTTAPLQPGAVRYLRERKSLIQPAPKIATHGADGGEKVDGWCLS